MLALGAGVVGVTVVSFGCGDAETPSSPVAPSATPALFAGAPAASLTVQTAIDPGSLGTDTVDLKSTAATPQAPINNIETADQNPTLVTGNAGGVFQNASFNYVFAVYKVDGGMTLVETGTSAQGTDSTSYQIQEPLEGGSSYQWRVRPFLDAAFGPWSALASFTTPQSVVIGPPTPVSPIDVSTGIRPVFNVTNPVIEGDAGTVIVQVQVAQDRGFSQIAAEGGTTTRDRGDTNIPIPNDLLNSTTYFWRTRARNDGQGQTALLPGVKTAAAVVSDWSQTKSFVTIAPGGTPTGGGGGGGGATPGPAKGQCCPPPNRLDIVNQVVNATGNLLKDNVQQFTEKVAQCLAVTDSDWGRRLNDSGAVGKDTVAYRVPGTPNPYSIDILQGAVSSNPIPHWSKHGQVGGSWFAVDATQCILGQITVH